MDWLKEGDRNTTFFRTKVRQRKEKKAVHFIMRSDGTMVTENSDILSEFSDYFSDLFQEPERALIGSRLYKSLVREYRMS